MTMKRQPKKTKKTKTTEHTEYKRLLNERLSAHLYNYTINVVIANAIETALKTNYNPFQFNSLQQYKDNL
jgi:hypothetical protein